VIPLNFVCKGVEEGTIFDHFYKWDGLLIFLKWARFSLPCWLPPNYRATYILNMMYTTMLPFCRVEWKLFFCFSALESEYNLRLIGNQKKFCLETHFFLHWWEAKWIESVNCRLFKHLLFHLSHKYKYLLQVNCLLWLSHPQVSMLVHFK
jgi:hypothetical protein